VKPHRKAGDIWVLRYRENRDHDKRVQNDLPVGPVRHFPKEKDAWREVDRLGLLVRINAQHLDNRIRFRALAEHYLTHDVGPDALRPKSKRTALNTNQIVRTYLLPHWGDSIADDIKPLDVQHWLKTLHTDKGLAWTTVSKFRGIMLRIYRIGALHQLVKTNPVLPVETRSTTNYKAILVTPKQTWKIIESLANPLHRILILTCAATALRVGTSRAALGRRAMGRESDCGNEALVAWKRRTHQDRQERRSCADAPGSRAIPAGLERKDAFRRRTGFSVSLAQGRRQGSHIACGIRRRSPPASRQSGGA